MVGPIPGRIAEKMLAHLRQWFPETLLGIHEAPLRFAFYFENPPELLNQALLWWRAQPPEGRLAVAGLLSLCAFYALVYLRPAFGSMLGVFLPYRWINTERMRTLFFSGTRAEFEKSWRTTGQPTRKRGRYLLDALYYTGPALVVAGAVAASFIACVRPVVT